jgi:hypothetical protein
MSALGRQATFEQYIASDKYPMLKAKVKISLLTQVQLANLSHCIVSSAAKLIRILNLIFGLNP